jgi:phospholipid/cholesterol/gamma-HCH transport system substrate-binding protein
MKAFSTEFKVGLFTIAAGLLIGYMFLFLNPKLFESTDYKTYYTVMRNAAGLVPNSHVRTNGVLIGKVKSVVLEDNATRITIEVDSEIKIPKGSTAEIKEKGFFGDNYLEIVRSDSNEVIPDGGFISHRADAMDMSAMLSVMGDIARDVKKVTSSLAGAMGGKEGEQRILDIVENIRDVTTDLRDVLSENKKDVTAIVQNLKVATDGLKEVLDQDNRDKVDRILASFDESMTEVKSATKNIKLISERVEKGEGTIGRLVNDDTTISEIEGALKDLREVLGAASKTQINVDTHSEFRKDETNQIYFNVALQTRPDRYYLLGFTDFTNNVKETRTETLENDSGDADRPASIRTRETVREDKALRFNLQFAKRWYFAALRLGLFESSGGVAADTYFFKDRLRMSFEAFDFKSKNNERRRTAHFKTYAQVNFLNHLYAMVGIDDFTRKVPGTDKVDDLNYFVGAGLFFNDQDLKAFLGTATLAK